MPFTCLKNGELIDSISFSTDEWNDFKVNYRAMNITMCCCGTDAIPKTSMYGTQFFSHKARGSCSITDESVEHMFAKYLIAKTAKELGWGYEFETRFDDYNQNMCISDVVLIKGKVKIFFEVQLSSQTLDKTKERYEKYLSQPNSRTVWLQKFGNKQDLKSLARLYELQCYTLPIFSLNVKQENGNEKITKTFEVIGVKSLNILRELDHSKINSIFHAKFNTMTFELTEFIKSLLTGNIQYIPNTKYPIFVKVILGKIACVECSQQTYFVRKLAYYFVINNKKFFILSTQANQMNSELVEILNLDENRKKFQIGKIFMDKQGKNDYLSNHCSYCGYIIHRTYEGSRLNDIRTDDIYDIELLDKKYDDFIKSHSNCGGWYYVGDER